MPTGISKAPQTLPRAAKKLWVDTFNAVFEECDGSEKECDQRAAKVAWDNVKRDYRKMGDKWVSKAEYEDSYHDVLLTITKASLQPDGSVRWQAVASDTSQDKANERTSVELFQDWIDRVTYEQTVPYLPSPKMPFLGVSHYPALGGFGEAGVTYRMYIDGDCFKADGVFNADSVIGQKLLDTVKAELTLIKKGGQVEKPIRISAGWWDIQHYHDDSNYLFTRETLTDKCPICEKGQTGDKVYKSGQLDHFAATRVPMNIRTSLELKSMARITRREDAESIVGPDEAEEMERRARMVGKSDTELPDGMVTRADTRIGNFIKRKREGMEMSIADLAAKTPVTDSTIGDIENGVIETPSKPVIAAIAKALKVSQEDLVDMLPGDAEPADKVAKGDITKGGYIRDMRKKRQMSLAEVAKRMGVGQRRLRRLEEDEEEIDDDMLEAMAEVYKASKDEKEELLARFGKKRRKAPPDRKVKDDEDDDDATIERMAYADKDMPMMAPLGGATSLKEAEGYIDNQDKMDKMYSYWDMMKAAYHNIQNDMMMEPGDKVKATSNLFREMAGKIDTLKAGLSDAFLIQESAAAYEYYEDEADEYIEYIEDYQDQEANMSEEITHPADRMKAVIDAALENKSLSIEDRETAVQAAFNEYAQEVQGQLEHANPARQSEQIAKSVASEVAKALGPIAEQIGLLTAKMNQQPVPQAHPQSGQGMQEVYFPQQKSMAPGQAPPQPVQVEGTPTGVNISPVLGKPSPLTDIIRKSVGL